jgi:hypothetical protein
MTAGVTDTSRIGPLRLVAQRLAGPAPDTAAEVVGRLTAVQAQDLPGALTSVALRTAGRDRSAVTAALDAGEVVRSWPLRGTLHLTRAEDLPWLLSLSTPRLMAGSAARRERLGLDVATLERAREAARAALSGGRALPRAELLGVWEAAGVGTGAGRGYHLLWYLAQTGTLCFGPTGGDGQLVVLVDEWIRTPRRLERDEALGELALRYFTGHGPATVKDFLRWTGLVAADARTGLALARPYLTRVEVDGVEHFLDPAVPDLLTTCAGQVDGVFLLPGFDEFVLGYADRSAVLPARFADRIVPGGNGMFRPTVVSAGQVVGTWRHVRRGARRTVEATPFTAFTAAQQRLVERAYAALP